MNTKKLKQLVLDLAIHGKLVPQDPNDEPASELLKRIQEEKTKTTKGKKIAISSDNLDEVPFEVSSGWVWTTIKDICSKIGSGSTPRGSNYSEEGIPFFRSQNIYNYGLVYDDIKYISEETHKSMIGTEVHSNDLLLNITGGSLGRCAVVPSNFVRGNVSQHVCILRTYIHPQFLHALIISDYFSSTMILSGSGREGLPKYSLESMSIPLPPLSEQKRIVSAIEKWFAVIDQIESNEADLRKSIEQTKKKVLDLAIHGKLVEQDENDEPASELLKRIKEEKAKTAKGKKAIADVEIDEVPFELPKGWVWCRLGDVISVKSGDGIKVRDTDGDKYPIYGGNGINGFHNSFNVESQTLLIGRVGFYCGSVHKTISKSWVTDNALIVSHEENAFCIDFLYRLLTWMNLGSTSNSTAQPVVSGKGILPLPIPLPPLSEQKRIVAKVEEVMGELDKMVEMMG